MDAVRRVDVVSSAEALNIANRVNSLQSEWIPRDSFALHSLGAAAYLDAPTATTVEMFGLEAPGKSSYDSNVAKYNELLRQNFADVYSRVSAVLADMLEDDVEMADGKALPGFHIFGHHKQYGVPTTHVAHYDRQFENLDWPISIDVRTTQTISFTLPVRLPSAGGGLLLWDVQLGDVLDLSRETAKARIKSAKTHREEYNLGTLVCHPGYQLHRIAPWTSVPGEQRITLQGHGLYIDNCWFIYW